MFLGLKTFCIFVKICFIFWVWFSKSPNSAITWLIESKPSSANSLSSASGILSASVSLLNSWLFEITAAIWLIFLVKAWFTVRSL